MVFLVRSRVPQAVDASLRLVCKVDAVPARGVYDAGVLIKAGYENTCLLHATSTFMASTYLLLRRPLVSLTLEGDDASFVVLWRLLGCKYRFVRGSVNLVIDLLAGIRRLSLITGMPEKRHKRCVNSWPIFGVSLAGQCSRKF